MEKRFDLCLIDREKAGPIMASFFLVLLVPAWFVGQFHPVNIPVRLSLPLTAGVCVLHYWWFRRAALVSTTVLLSTTVLTVRTGIGQYQLPLATIGKHRYVVARGAYTLLLCTATSRVRLATSTLLVGENYANQFELMVHEVEQALSSLRS